MKADEHRWRFKHGLADPALTDETRALQCVGLLLCDVLEQLEKLEMWERMKSREQA